MDENAINRFVDKIIDAIETRAAKKARASFTQAKVLRVDGDTAWIHIPGGAEETPAKKTIDCKKGDVVRVRNGGGTPIIIGNETAPPTDDTKAIKAQATADAAIKAAAAVQEEADGLSQYFWHVDGDGSESGAHVTEIPGAVFRRDPAGGNLLLRSNSVKLRNALSILAEFVTNGTNFYDADTGTIVAAMRYQKDYLDRNVYSLSCGGSRVFASQELRAADTYSQYVISAYWDDGVDDGDTTAGVLKNAYAVQIDKNSSNLSLFQLTDTKFSVGSGHNTTADIDAATGEFSGLNAHQVMTAQVKNYVTISAQSSYYNMTLESALKVGDNLSISGGGIKCAKAGTVLVSGQVQFYGVSDHNVCNLCIEGETSDDVIDLAHSAARAAGDRTEVVVSPRLVSVVANEIIHITVANTSSDVGKVGTTSSSVTAADKIKNYLTVQYV